MVLCKKGDEITRFDGNSKIHKDVHYKKVVKNWLLNLSIQFERLGAKSFCTIIFELMCIF
jgi:hypothetical protein